MKIITTKKFANQWGGIDPYKVDFAHEEEKAKSIDTDSLFGALKDAIEASQVSVNAGKYFDQASVYRKELMRRGISIKEQDKQLQGMKGLHSNPVDNDRNLDYSESGDNTFANSVKTIRTANYKLAQLDIVKCVACGITKSRDQMANSEVCHDCNDKDNYENS